MKHRLKIFLCSLLAAFATANAQELNCHVEVNSSQVSGTSSVFETLQDAIAEYLNSTTFSNAQFATNERIDCQFVITVKSYEDNLIKGDIQVQSTRPVYNSSYTTTVLNFKDSKIDFEYQEGDPLVFSINNWENQLTGLLNFYAYLILALDFDTFSSRGGEIYWEKVKTIVQQGQSSGQVGWKAFEDTKNRAAVSAVFTDASTQAIRDMLYQYHRLGLDQMALSPDKGRSEIHKSLQYVENLHKASSMSVGLSMFKDAKMDELVNIYSKAPEEERKEAYELLQKVYPAENTRLEKIRKGDETK